MSQHTRNRSVLLILAVAVLLLAAVLLAVSSVAASGPVLWKEHCPRLHDVRTVPDLAGDGVHILCVRMAEAGQKR